MSTIHRLRRNLPALLATVVATVVAAGSLLLGPAPAGATDLGPMLPQTAVAQAAASWLARQLTPQGFIPSVGAPNQPDLSSTANTVLALAASGTDAPRATAALSYLESDVDTYVSVDGSDGPGQLALLVLDATALGVSPTDFGGTDLVSRLEATEQTTGDAIGRFGTDLQVADYAAGPYQQGLALAALKAAGVTADADAISYLLGQQCSDGGWTLPDIATNPCDGQPADYAGPDTNTTSVAVEGLVAQGALSGSAENDALTFLQTAQDPDAGWGYYPDPSQTAGNSDPDSTSLVTQALVALGQDPTGATYTVEGATPVSYLLTNVVTSGPDVGAVSFPGGAPGAGDLLATYQSIPALVGVAFPLASTPAPTVTGLAPVTSGPVAGGTGVVIDGTNLTTAASVRFGTTPATSLTVEGPTSVYVTAPPASVPGTVDVTVTTFGGTTPTSAADRFTYVATSGPYTPITPTRVCDTRPGNPSGLTGPAAQCNGAADAGETIAAGGTLTVAVAGSFNVPADALAVVVNVTAVHPAATGYLTVFPAGTARPGTSSLNYPAGGVVPNLVQIGLGATGQLSVFSNSRTDVVVDLEGYVAPTTAGDSGAGLYQPVALPSRICDTRAGNPSGLTGGASQCNGAGNQGERLTAGGTLTLRVATNGGVPVGALAAVVNVTAADPASAGNLTVYPAGATQPVASNVNYAAGQNAANRVITLLSTGTTPGEIDITSTAAVDVIVDVSGWYTSAGGVGAAFTPEPVPVRICDTRPGNPSGLSGTANQCDGTTISPSTPDTVQLVGLAGIPADATGVVLNVTAIHPTERTFLRVYPGPNVPVISDINATAGSVVGNLVVVTPGPGGAVAVSNAQGSTDVTVDVVGWYS